MASVIKLLTVCMLAGVASAAPQCMAVGSLGARFQKNLAVNDADGDGVVTGNEIYNDFSNNYDKDKDGCVTLKEWTDRWTGFFQLSAAYAYARFAHMTQDVSAACPAQYALYQNNNNISFPLAGFLEGNLETLVQLCQSKPDLANTNCDCAQL